MSAEGGHPYQRGSAASITLDLPADLMRARNAWIAEQPEPRPERLEAVALALRDWLTGLGMLQAGERHEGLH